MGPKRLRLPALLCVLALVAGACTESSDDGAGPAGAGGADGGEDVARSGRLADEGPCDPDLPTYPLGIMTVFESPLLSLIDQVKGAEASVEAFNARGGIGGHCMELRTCDTQLDPNAEVDCARELVDAGVVATVNDTTAANPEGVVDVTVGAGLPRIGVSPGTTELAAPNSYPIGGGSAGTTFMMIPALARTGVSKMAMIHVDTPQIQALGSLAAPMLEAYGAELTAMIPVPSGTTDFQQFVLAAQDSGAEGVMLALGEAEAIQVINAAQQLGTDMTFSLSLGTFGQTDVEELGDFASQIVFNSEVPPATASLDEWPILGDVVADLAASGEPELQRDEIKASPVRSWMAVYALKTIVEQFGTPDDISRQAVTTAFENARNVDFLGLIPSWTPRGGTGEGIFGRVANPYYYSITFDVDAGEFVIADEQMNLVEEVAGNTEYAQPGG